MCKYRIKCEGLYVPSIWLWKGFTSSPSRNHGAVQVQVPEIMAQNGCCTSLPWTSDTFSFGLTSWQLPQSCLRCSRAMFRKFWTCLEDCTKWTGSNRSCILVKELGVGDCWGRVGQPSWNGWNVQWWRGIRVWGWDQWDDIFIPCIFNFLSTCCRRDSSCQGSFRCRPGMSGFIMRILFGWWQNKATLPLPISPNAFVCCDIGYVKVDVLSNIFWGNTTLAFLHQLKHPSHIKIAWKVGWS